MAYPITITVKNGNTTLVNYYNGDSAGYGRYNYGTFTLSSQASVDVYCNAGGNSQAFIAFYL